MKWLNMGDWEQRLWTVCATQGCSGQPVCYANINGVGSYYCADCKLRLDLAVTAYEQPAPRKSNGPAIWDLVIQDMRVRDALGRERYGTPLQPHNGRDALHDAYAEALDLAVYLRQAIFERDKR